MNKVFLSGMITGKPELRVESGEIPHLILRLGIRHKAKNGELRSEIYRVSAWHNAARWGAENLHKGQIIGVQGYLTQRRVNAGSIAVTEIEIAVDEFLAGIILPEHKVHDPVGSTEAPAIGDGFHEI